MLSGRYHADFFFLLPLLVTKMVKARERKQCQESWYAEVISHKDKVLQWQLMQEVLTLETPHYVVALLRITYYTILT